MTKRVITFGEIMLRLAPEGYTRFIQADSSVLPMEEGKQTWPYRWPITG